MGTVFGRYVPISGYLCIYVAAQEEPLGTAVVHVRLLRKHIGLSIDLAKNKLGLLHCCCATVSQTLIVVFISPAVRPPTHTPKQPKPPLSHKQLQLRTHE